ncbi:hypothetical protein L208DRAFT_1378500 [Tricholoma matsutake]|nr:hypothetical protein L208DRAFT_1378500 [Tricholoma matsutake 945]
MAMLQLVQVTRHLHALMFILYSQKGVKQKNPFVDDECEVSGDALSDSPAASDAESLLPEPEGEAQDEAGKTAPASDAVTQVEQSDDKVAGAGAEGDESDRVDSDHQAVTHHMFQDKNVVLFDEYILIKSLGKAFDANVLQSILAFVKFSQLGTYVNMAHATPHYSCWVLL